MRALQEAWFEFGGVRSDALGVEMLSRPQREQPAEKGAFQTVPGRSGRLWLSEGAYEDGTAEVACMAPEGQMDEILAWLTGEGWLRFSDEPDRSYRARVINGMTRTQPFARLAAQKFTVQFACEPFRYVYPAAADVVMTAAGSIVNPGTAAALPKVRVEGSGDFIVRIGDGMMAFEDISGGVVVDCEAMECLNLAEDQLLNGSAHISAFPTLLPGGNMISWTGNVTKVTITPRWRYI